jgi:ABC-type uncharacterized transport system permease subunit
VCVCVCVCVFIAIIIKYQEVVVLCVEGLSVIDLRNVCVIIMSAMISMCVCKRSKEKCEKRIDMSPI